MTRVRYGRGNYWMEIDGHAGAGEPGQDIVCAAATMLMRTLEEAVQRHGESMRPGIRHRAGYARIQCSPARGARTRCRTIFETVFVGYELLSERYPEHVRADIVEEDE